MKQPPRARRSTNTFKPLERTQELKLLQGDSPEFEKVRRYLRTLVRQALARFEIRPTDQARLTRQILLDVPIAAERFLTQAPRRRYTFAAYFAWYIARRIKSEGPRRRS